MLQIIAADVSMSLDNVLAVAGAARDHEVVLWIGLALSVVLMAVAAELHRPHPRPPSLGRLDRLRHHPLCRRQT